jgi:hypothetical protein
VVGGEERRWRDKKRKSEAEAGGIWVINLGLQLSKAIAAGVEKSGERMISES